MYCLACNRDSLEPGQCELWVCAECGFAQGVGEMFKETGGFLSPELIVGLVKIIQDTTQRTGSFIPAVELLFAIITASSFVFDHSPEDVVRELGEITRKAGQSGGDELSAGIKNYRESFPAKKGISVNRFAESVYREEKPDLDKPGALEEIKGLEDQFELKTIRDLLDETGL